MPTCLAISGASEVSSLNEEYQGITRNRTTSENVILAWLRPSSGRGKTPFRPTHSAQDSCLHYCQTYLTFVQNLSHECARFRTELSPPDVSFVNDEALSIWTTVQRQVQAPALDSGPPHEPLLSL